MAKIQKGWLKTREGEYFSPITLAENIYSRDGKKYDDVIKGYINDVTGDQSELGQKIDDLYERLKNFNGSDADTFYIVDNQGNIIFKIDAQGAYSTNFTSLDGNLNQVIADLAKETADRNQQYLLLTNKDIELANLVNSNKTEIDDIQAKIRNFKNEEDDEVLYITDATGNIIAKIDNEGVQSINFKSLDGNLNETISKLNKEIELRNNQFISLSNKNTEVIEKINLNVTNIEDIYNKIRNFKNEEDDDTFYITDSEGNVIFKVLDGGVYTTNLNTLKYDVNATLDRLFNLDSSLQSIINDRLKNFDGNDDDILYITDNDGNIIAQFDQNGLFVKDVKIQNGKTLQKDSLFYSIENYKEINI